MLPVPRKPRMPMTLENGRGVLVSSHVGKVVGKMCRGRLVDALGQAAGPLQFGAVRGGGIDAPGFAVRLFLADLAARKANGAVLFTDLKSAFYTVFKEAALGPLTSAAAREARLRQLGLTAVEVMYLRHLVEAAPRRLHAVGSDPRPG